MKKDLQNEIKRGIEAYKVYMINKNKFEEEYFICKTTYFSDCQKGMGRRHAHRNALQPAKRNVD